MNINLPSVSPPIPGLSTGTEIQKQTAESGGLSRTFEKLLQDVNQQQLNAEAKQIELMVTDNKDIHGTMLALEKADLSLRLMLQIRNKLVNAYEEVMRMQV
ncbi:MAG TPA: flagellar hook-basal body complex protein FliE [Candidatus Lambdaproteobacteria bacterium]|nr:flagellar hook-basal body complex protein FliE [SAR324 cluster bacterium]HIA55882.1 flagellar hook-basal body complex protein FliE [Candidatus Lambdaproteobacteria bacterium]HIN47243.1 flagellar hook-basal body complex protein FliE [Deltaproteobacteria bacterium]HIB46030.1 flagellar hook-basal body complex protein FliE [Candidatus Lambdaproteobacteria bacterium]HIB94213.1 flagellar hook-basal body complex protein FliE [Candidatus Lambdaproteobacteria bacterium]